MSDWQVGTVTLTGDLEWIDRTRYSSTTQTEESSLDGSLIIEKWTRSVGRPITLDTNRPGVWVTYADVVALEALRDNSETDIFTLTEPDGTERQVRFRYSNGEPIDAAPIRFRSIPEPTDAYNLTLRLMTA